MANKQWSEDLPGYFYLKQFSCPKCGRLFKPEKNYQIFCSLGCENIYSVELQKIDDKRNKKCISCNAIFRKAKDSSSQAKCETCKYSKRRQKALAITYSPEKFINKKKKKKVFFEKLIKMNEYKRVMDDSGWDHYLRGRKWDKI